MVKREGFEKVGGRKTMKIKVKEGLHVAKRRKGKCVMSAKSDSMLRLAFSVPAGVRLPCSIHAVKRHTHNFSAASLQHYICRHIDIS